MSEITIEQKNILIGVFDGWMPDYGGQGSPFYWKEAGFTPLFALPEQLKYHTSWDWLMPVWFKIQTIGADLGYSFKRFHEKFHAGIDHQKIEMCHQAVYQFIVWYNQKQKEQQPNMQIDKLDYRGPNSNCKACEDEAHGIRHIRAQIHTCKKGKP